MAQRQSHTPMVDPRRFLNGHRQPPRDSLTILLVAHDGADSGTDTRSESNADPCTNRDRLRQHFAAAPPGYRLIEADTLTKALGLWHTGTADWVLIDLSEPGQSGQAGRGLEFLAALGDACPQRPLPAVVLVGPGQERAALEAMKRGAADYLFTADLTAEALWAIFNQQCPAPVSKESRALEQASQTYQTLVDHSPDIVERFDLNLRHLYVSPVLAQLTGIDTTAFLGKTCRQLGLNETMVNTWEAAAAIATGKNQAVEFTTPTRVGIRHFEMAIVPERAEDGQLTSLLCVSRDITDRVVAQQTQHQLLAEAQAAQHQATVAHADLTSVFDRINDGMIAFDQDSCCVYLNQSAERILGRSQADLIGKYIWAEFPEAVDTPVYEVYQRAVAQQQPERLEYYFPPLGGWFEVRLYPDHHGVTIYFTDISDRKAAVTNRQHTERLRHELSLLEQILDSVLAGCWDFDFQQGTAYYSPGFKAMFGYADDEIPNQLDTWQQLIVDEDIPKAWASLERHVQSRGEVLHYVEARYRHKDGSPIWVICAGQVIDWDEAGQPRRMVGCHVDITRLKQAEAQLRKNEAHLQAAQRIGNLGSWEFDVASEHITWSDQVYRIFGLTVGERPASFEALQSLFHPDDRDRHRQTVEAIMATHQPYNEEFCIVRPDGHLGHIHVKGEVIVDGAGHLTHLTGTVQDISDRKRDEAQRQAAEAQLQNLSLRLSLALESARIGSWERDLATNAVTWDPCLIDLYGFGDLGRPANYHDWRNRVYADDIDRVEAGHQNLIEGRAPYDIEFRVWRGDGTLGWIRSSALVQRDAQGQPAKIVGINYDITEKKQAAAELQALSVRLSLALESGGFGSWEWELDSNAVNWDQRLTDLYGLGDLGRPITYQDWRCRVHSQDIAMVEAAMQATLDTDAPYDIEFRIHHSASELRWIKSHALVNRTPQGKPISIIGINYDITEKKRAEEQLLRTTAQLEASNRELEAFAYSVSHDLRAPLRAIDGFSRALVEDYGDQFGDEGRDYFARIRYNVGRMGQLIDDLLRLSRVSRSAIAYAPVNLSALVQEQIDDLRAAEPDRRVTVTIRPNLLVTADPTLLRMAIANLVQNAWKFTAHHTTAHLEFGAIAEAKETVYFLRDDGAGFDMAYADKLFGVFQRLHNAQEFPGTGIGLATVQRVIHRHRGRVWAKAAVEQGTTIYFTLAPAPAEEPP